MIISFIFTYFYPGTDGECAKVEQKRLVGHVLAGRFAFTCFVESRLETSEIVLPPIGNPSTATALDALLLSIVIANWANFSTAHDLFSKCEESRTATKSAFDSPRTMTCGTGITAGSYVCLKVAFR